MSTENKPFLETYTRLTAENILRQLDVSLTDKQLYNLIKQDEAFYKKILTPFCENIINQQILEYCEELANYGNSEIHNISMTYRNYMKRNQIEQSTEDPILVEIAAVNDQFNTLKFRHHNYSDQQKKLLAEVKEIVLRYMRDWQKFHSNSAAEITAALKADGYSLPDNFQQKLTENLVFQAFTVSNEVPEKLRKDLKIKKRAPTLIENALINALSEER